MASHISFRSLSRVIPVGVLMMLAVAPQPGHAAFSTDKNNPTVLPWSQSLTISGTVSQPSGAAVGGVSPFAQYVSFTVPQGWAFNGLNLLSFDSTDTRGFVALQAGSQWTAVPNPTTGALPGSLAYHHFGTGAGARGSLCAQTYIQATPVPTGVCATNPTANSNLFTRSISAPIGGPLQAGTYTLWLQQTAATPVTFTFEASFQPVPSPLPLLGAAAGFGFSRRLRQRIRTGVAEG